MARKMVQTFKEPFFSITATECTKADPASHGISDRWAHSVQVSFLAPGQPGEEMHYQVRTLMQGRSFQVQQVLGTQGARTVIGAVPSTPFSLRS